MTTTYKYEHILTNYAWKTYKQEEELEIPHVTLPIEMWMCIFYTYVTL